MKITITQLTHLVSEAVLDILEQAPQAPQAPQAASAHTTTLSGLTGGTYRGDGAGGGAIDSPINRSLKPLQEYLNLLNQLAHVAGISVREYTGIENALAAADLADEMDDPGAGAIVHAVTEQYRRLQPFQNDYQVHLDSITTKSLQDIINNHKQMIAAVETKIRRLQPSIDEQVARLNTLKTHHNKNVAQKATKLLSAQFNAMIGQLKKSLQQITDLFNTAKPKLELAINNFVGTLRQGATSKQTTLNVVQPSGDITNRALRGTVGRLPEQLQETIVAAYRAGMKRGQERAKAAAAKPVKPATKPATNSAKAKR